MVKINFRVMIAGMICLTLIYIALILCDHDTSTIGFAIIGTIALITGVVMPAPKIDRKGGMKFW